MLIDDKKKSNNPLFIYLKAITCDKSIHRLSPICDEHLLTTSTTSSNALSNNEHFPNFIPSDDSASSSLPATDTNSTTTTLSRHSTKSPSHQATLLARRHFHVYDWTRLSFYDNVPPPLDYQSEPTFLEHRSLIGTSTSSTEEKNSKRSSLIHIRSSTDRKDSGLGASSVERQIDSLVSPNTTDPLHRSTTSISLSSSSSSSSSENDATNTIPSSSTATTTTPLRLPTSRKIRVKWHSFTKSHRPSFNSSKYHLGQMSVGQLFALRRAASIRIQELFDTTRILSSSSNKDEQTRTLVNSTVATPQSLLATAFSAVPKLIIRRHQQRKVRLLRVMKSFSQLNLLGRSTCDQRCEEISLRCIIISNDSTNRTSCSDYNHFSDEISTTNIH